MVRKFQDPPPGPPLVVKVGGSLYSCVPDLVPVLLASGRPLLIIPGGGRFADAARKCRVDDDSAHWMAIAAMDQYGWYIASHGMTTTTLLQTPNRPSVFLPYCSVQKQDPLPHSWDVTSDSISAWIANLLGVDLILLKSVDGIIEQGGLVKRIKFPVKTDVVDPFFIPFILEKKVRTTIINGSCIDRVEKFLGGETVPGTMIGTTF
jgi:aspartokinase-like uncharacterized kinase